MKELQLIISAYYQNKTANIKTALATVVKVDGSAYRRPGARMLVSESGQITGAISGGCLEGDALRKAQAVIFQNKSMLVTYDTTDEDDQKFGIGLGCNGIIQVLIEPLDYDDPSNPVLLLEYGTRKRITSTILTVFSLLHSRATQIGTVLLRQGEQEILSSNLVDTTLIVELQSVGNQYNKNKSSVVELEGYQGLHVFVEVIKPSIQLLLFGAGNDTIPLAQMADVLGWSLIVIDGRKQYATKERFPTARQIVVSPAEEVVNKLSFDANTVVLLMTHNFEYEAVVLSQLLSYDLSYIGILGPKKKSEKLFERLNSQGKTVPEAHIFGPIGLDIGAEGSEEIALSILSEIKAVMAQRTPLSLREKPGPIHD
ncbi:Xanthine and CO dehydrogenase maturation factor, XdhC/CoxF family [Belliella buryatensis]|uniref:Xanthine and CO dehydrogenase maturation factor, XdhC/CoxF family n=1 Tax=Belliella buryatensis TaxID=1500549 RepID=A0A239EVQ1_9BACT|nr:XdhC/CoxI family protein [Belliella buryatensis]SNS48840.1 Xanthine and CO dehydrogenase maturation factor, XdhC/CoxF family [Belliella buryatensis]